MRKSLINSLLMLIIILGLITSARWPLPAVSPDNLLDNLTDQLDEISREEILAERYWRMVDEKGREIMVTGRRIHVGDEFISFDNKLYRVYRVRGRTAYARLICEIGVLHEEERGFFVHRMFWSVPVQTEKVRDDLALEQAPQQLIGIYLTHNAESFVPTDGTHSIFGKGGIHSVGAAFARALEGKGVRVIFDQTLHLPHDRGAYRRSRPTAERLLREGPDAIFDVHRDAAPRHAYAREIDGEWVTQIKLVVGRQNPNMRLNRQFALDLKNTADQIQPGLVKGIFLARGNYNQDLSPLNLLLEAGAHTNSREAAERGIVLFSEVVATYFYGPPEAREPAEELVPGLPLRRPAPGAQAARGNRSAVIGILLLFGFTVTVAVGFVLLNVGRISDLASFVAPRIARINDWFAPADRFLGPLSTRIFESTGSLRRLLEPAAEQIDRFFGSAGQTIAHSIPRFDHNLAGLAEKIYASGLHLKAALAALLESGEKFALPVRQSIRGMSLNLWASITQGLQEGDRMLAAWQGRVRELVLTARGRLLEFFSRRLK